MVASMTAFAREAMHEKWGQAVWEIRSVNHRYLDMSFKVPDSFRQWEPAWRQRAASVVQRGKIDFSLSFIASDESLPQLEVNTGLVAQLLTAMKEISIFPGVEANVKALDILRWPEVLTTKKSSLASLQDPLNALLERALQDLRKTRLREGSALQQVVVQKLEQTDDIVNAIRHILPEVQKARRERLQAKLQELKQNVEPQRLEQEIILFIQRSDIEEELDRLKAHIKEVENSLVQREAIGRRLDFLMQEMNREANTLAAKALDHVISEKAVALKVLIEQMREQIQNVE